ncbi:MAG: hypothetical protein H6704_15440 [Myxococcales bacterium]|nr:hypothetical protein [Myxococcales bacterium]MCB9537644.1 hypothetical protein [Myxococcales bacterium]
MGSLSACPRCGRKAQKSISSNWFPVYMCHDCKTKSCNDCGGTRCPKCGSSKHMTSDKVYAR